MSGSIQTLSLVLAETFGVPALWHAHTSPVVILIFIFGVACGGLGSRLSSMWRERMSERQPKCD
jgi:hypothetical protein